MALRREGVQLGQSQHSAARSRCIRRRRRSTTLWGRANPVPSVAPPSPRSRPASGSPTSAATASGSWMGELQAHFHFAALDIDSLGSSCAWEARDYRSATSAHRWPGLSIRTWTPSRAPASPGRTLDARAGWSG